MSRVGKAIIDLPKGVSVEYKQQVVRVKGPKGELHQLIEPGFEFDLEDNIMTVQRPSEQKRHRALHGLYRALVNNMVKGVSEGYELTLELIGVGYRAEAKGQILELSLGYSHQTFFVVPDELSIETVSTKGQAPKVILKGIDKQLIGQVAAKIRKLRPPEPYKGKGIRYEGEQVRRKAGKAAGKGKK